MLLVGMRFPHSAESPILSIRRTLETYHHLIVTDQPKTTGIRIIKTPPKHLQQHQIIERYSHCSASHCCNIGYHSRLKKTSIDTVDPFVPFKTTRKSPEDILLIAFFHQEKS